MNPGAGEGVEDAASFPASKDFARDSGPRWDPVLPLWRYWVLSIVTLAAYLPIWVVAVAREQRRQHDPRIRPWLYFFGILGGVTAPVVMAMLCRHVDRSAWERGVAAGPPSILIVALAVPAAAFALAGFGIADVVATTPRHAFNATWTLLAGFVLLVPLPASLLQWKLNRLKSALADPERPLKQRGFTAGQFAVLAFGSVTWLFALYASPLDRIFEAPGVIRAEAIASNSKVSGLSAGYRLTVRSDGWSRMPYYARAEDADLELRGPPGATVLVYVHNDGRTLEEIVRYRRTALRRTVADFSADDLLPGSDEAVSHARYDGVNPQDLRDTTWWVTTVATPSGAVEVVGLASGSDSVQSEVEALVRSVRFEPANGG